MLFEQKCVKIRRILPYLVCYHTGDKKPPFSKYVLKLLQSDGSHVADLNATAVRRLLFLHVSNQLQPRGGCEIFSIFQPYWSGSVVYLLICLIPVAKPLCAKHEQALQGPAVFRLTSVRSNRWFFRQSFRCSRLRVTCSRHALLSQ